MNNYIIIKFTPNIFGEFHPIGTFINFLIFFQISYFSIIFFIIPSVRKMTLVLKIFVKCVQDTCRARSLRKPADDNLKLIFKQPSSGGQRTVTVTTGRGQGSPRRRYSCLTKAPQSMTKYQDGPPSSVCARGNVLLLSSQVNCDFRP